MLSSVTPAWLYIHQLLTASALVHEPSRYAFYLPALILEAACVSCLQKDKKWAVWGRKIINQI